MYANETYKNILANSNCSFVYFLQWCLILLSTKVITLA